MNKISLHIPTIEELWFRKEFLSDPKTMEYNAGYDVNYEGYHYQTGCIDFDKSNWESWYNRKLNNPNFFYAYIKDNETNQFVGECNLSIDTLSKTASIGIVIKNEFQGKHYMRPALELLINEAKQRNIKVLTNTVPKSREKALKVFFSMGFQKVEEINGFKFGKNEIIYMIEKNL